MASNVNLSTIIKRLEAVTSRLEDVASSQQTSPALKSPTGNSHEAVAGHVSAPSATQQSSKEVGGGAGAGVEASPAVKAYEDDIVNGALASCIAKSKEIGGIVEQHTALLEPLCQAQFEFLQLASTHSKPAASAFGTILKPQSEAIMKVMETKDTLNRSKEGREWGACLSVIGEGVGAWGWVQVEPAPAPYIGEMKNAAQFWADRVTKQFKETNPTAIAWAKSFSELLDALQKYVKQYQTTGVVWNPKGEPAPSSMPSLSNGSGAPAPPTPPPAESSSTAKSAGAVAAGAGGAGALLAALNKGGSVTSGLKKVDSSQMTHKNPELRTSSTVPDNQKKAPPAIGKKPAVVAKKPPKFELEDGNKWMVENQDGNRDIVIDQTGLQYTVHIFGCTNSTIRVIGKINAVSMVGCKKTALVMESAVSSLSITSSPSFEVQITGTVPTVQVDTTDSGQVYLSKECMDIVEIITSKTSSINISVPTGDEGDFVENALPEQIKSTFKNGKVVSEIVEHAG